MSGRVCLLCEKPLGRVWLGAGEDFCSREHRNQYRLRRGMDRLLEANKMASLMRRRESPKPITLFREISESAIARHAILEAPFPVRDDQPLAPPDWRPCQKIRSITGLPSVGQFADSLPGGRDAALPERQIQAAPPLGQRPKLAVAPARRAQPNLLLPGAGAVAASASPSGGESLPRDAGITWQATRLLHLDSNRQLDPAAFHPFEERHAERMPARLGPRGYTLRVSLGSGFHVQSPVLCRLRVEPPAAAVPQGSSRGEKPPFPREGLVESLWISGPPLLGFYPSAPKPEWSRPGVYMEWPGIIPPVNEGPYAGPELELRALPGSFTGFPPAFPAPSRHRGRDAAAIRRLVVTLSGAAPAPMVAAVPIGCAADGVESRPGAPQESRNSVEERFDDGWENWEGAFASWNVDAAGTRTNGLALYSPSMEWRDYEMEFFTRIENHSVSFVFRADSLSDYYMATLAALPDKGFALTRRTVLRGRPGVALTAPLTILPNPKAAYLIRLKVAGNQFSLSIDGQRIETWTDNRFSMGGAGFVGAPDDRARIYWVRFYPGPSKEPQRK